MKFGVREICDVVFKAKSDVKIGTANFTKGQPVLYIDSAKTSNLEEAATTVYAQGGKGNARLIAWEGEKTLTFTVEDALLSPIGFAILSGAGLFKHETEEVHVHSTSMAVCEKALSNIEINLEDSLEFNEKIDGTAPVFVSIVEEDGSITGELISNIEVDSTGKKLTHTGDAEKYGGKAVFVDFYVIKKSANVSELQIDAANFAGYYYVEASTLFRRQSDGVDMPAELTFPNVKVQSNFTFAMASSGDPSTFTFTMDAMPGYTMFDKKHKVMCVMQVVEDATSAEGEVNTVMGHVKDSEEADKKAADAVEALIVTAVGPEASQEDITTAREGYDKLTDYQKMLVSNYDDLVEKELEGVIA